MAAAARVVTGSAVPALLVALLACAAARVAVVVGGASPCDGVDCGMGTCVRVLELAHNCVCDPGWAQYTPFLPCTIPNCSTGDSCLNITLPLPTVNITFPIPPDFAVCKLVDICGPQGTCVTGKNFLDFQCQCNPGAVNILNITISPCIRNCVIGKDGCPVPPPPNPPPPSAPSSPAPPPGNHDSSGPTAPSSTKGSVSSLQNLLLLLLMLASLAAVQIV